MEARQCNSWIRARLNGFGGEQRISRLSSLQLCFKSRKPYNSIVGRFFFGTSDDEVNVFTYVAHAGGVVGLLKPGQTGPVPGSGV